MLLSTEQFLKVKNEILKSGRAKCRIISNSMEPIIKVNEKIDVEPLQEDLRPFDIIVFFFQDKLICHWVVKPRSEFDTNRIITASFNPIGLDFPVSREQILGKVISHQMSWLNKIKIFLKFRS